VIETSGPGWFGSSAPLVRTYTPRAGEVEGVITAANVVGPLGQGVAAGDFARLVFALRAGQTYVNVHTTRSPGGEIRSQIDHVHSR